MLITDTGAGAGHATNMAVSQPLLVAGQRGILHGYIYQNVYSFHVYQNQMPDQCPHVRHNTDCHTNFIQVQKN